METDGVDEQLGNAARTAFMAASRVGEQLSRVRENQLRHSEARSAQEARELQNRLDTERLAARAQLASVNRSEWWDKAEISQVVDSWQTANAWRSIDPEIDRVAGRIEDEVRARYGYDVNDTGARPDQVREHLQRVLETRQLAAGERTQAQKAEEEAIVLLLEADALRDTREYGGDVDDVPADEAKEREIRDQADSLLEAAGDHNARAAQYEKLENVEAREAIVTADKGQAYPARLATATSAKSSKRSKRPRSEAVQERSVSR